MDIRNEQPVWGKNLADVQAPAIPPAQQPPVPQGQGGSVPFESGEGLYTMFGKRDPHKAETNMYATLAGSMKDKPASILAYYLMGKSQKASREFEKERGAEIKAMTDRKNAYDSKVRTREENQKDIIMAKTVFGMLQTNYSGYLDKMNYEDAGKEIAKDANRILGEKNIAMPIFDSITPFNTGETFMTYLNPENPKELLQGKVTKTGTVMQYDRKNKTYKRMPEGFMVLSKYAKFQSDSAKAAGKIAKSNAPQQVFKKGQNGENVLVGYYKPSEFKALIESNPNEHLSIFNKDIKGTKIKGELDYANPFININEVAAAQPKEKTVEKIKDFAWSDAFKMTAPSIAGAISGGVKSVTGVPSQQLPFGQPAQPVQPQQQLTPEGLIVNQDGTFTDPKDNAVYSSGAGGYQKVR